MRSLIAVAASVAMLAAQVPFRPAFGQSPPPAPQATIQPSAIIDATFKAFPNGGEPLSMRITDLIAANPKLAAEFVVYMRSAQGLSRAQKLAGEHGLAAAADRLGITAQARAQVGGDPWAWVWALAAIGVGVGGGLWGASQGNGNGFVPAASGS
jgi:hypothetical protein